MKSSEAPTPRREPLAMTVSIGLGFALASGIGLGSLEAAKVLFQGYARYSSWAWELLGIATVGYAALALVLGAIAVATASILWGRPGHRTAPPSICAGLGAALALAAFILSDKIGLGLAPFAAIAATLLTIAFRELLGWSGGWLRPWRVAAASVLAWLLAAAAAWRAPDGSASRPNPDRSRPNVVLLSIDTLRADRVGCYGSPTVRTPALDRLASEGVLFENASSQANITGPSHVSMLTGTYPAEHGVFGNGQPIPNETRTWVEELARSGYQTAGFVGGFTLVDAACKLAQRFDWYDDELLAWRWCPEAATRLRLIKDCVRYANARGWRPMRPDRPAGEVVDAVDRWLERRDAARPFVLFAHFYDPHVPYEPPAPFDRTYDSDWKGDPRVDWYRLPTERRRELVSDPAEFAHMLALHHGEISYADQQAGRLLDALRERGLFDDALVIVTSDHGEELGEHEIFFDHGSTLYDTELHVPLILKLPGSRSAGVKVPAQVRSIDLGPTVLATVGVESSLAMSGKSLLDLIGRAEPERASFAFNDLPGNMSEYELDARGLSLRQGGFKLIWTSEHWMDSRRIGARFELYDLAQDPLELRDLFPAPTEAARAALEQLMAPLESLIRATEGSAGQRPLSEEARTGLKATGYF